MESLWKGVMCAYVHFTMEAAVFVSFVSCQIAISGEAFDKLATQSSTPLSDNLNPLI